MSNMFNDEVGRTFCQPHRRDSCHVCGMEFRPTNEMVEISAGLRPKPSRMEKLAKDRVMLMRGIAFMRNQPGRVVAYMKQNIEDHKVWLAKAEKEIAELIKADSTASTQLAAATAKAKQEIANQDAERDAISRAWVREYPNKKYMEFVGEDTQRLYDKFASVPVERSGVDIRTCSYCRKGSAVPLKKCAKCQHAYYCNNECQKAAWKAHKKVCKVPDTKPAKQKLPLTWAQLEGFNGDTAEGHVLVVRVLGQKLFTRQVLLCKDSQGVTKRVAAYTNSGKIPGAAPGVSIHWKNPRFHRFTDGSDGARFEESDLKNIELISG
ncbi:hypothetical protein HDU98_007833 [Podochytrium sp. JEL0797]|nr:hypothetical protein HDU98_007833 [Podochytrium sp. JEL0797]